MTDVTEPKLLDRCAMMLGYSDENKAGCDKIFRILRSAHEEAIRKNEEHQTHTNDPCYEWEETDTRDEPFTAPGFIVTYMEICNVINREVSEENAFKEYSVSELNTLEVINNYGKLLTWLVVFDHLDEGICEAISAQSPMSEQEYFNRYVEIYRIAHEKEFFLNCIDSVW